MTTALPARASVESDGSRFRLSEYPAVPLALTALFSAYIVEWYLELGQRVGLLGAIRFEFLLGSFLTLAATVSVAQRSESNHSRLTKYICAYFLFLLLHLPFSQFLAISWDTFLNHVVKYACIALFIYAFVRSPWTLRVFVAMLLLSFAKIGQEAFLGNITGSMVWENQGIMRLNGTQGSMFGHPNSLSGFAVSTLPLLYYLFPVVKGKWKLCVTVLLMFAFNMIIFTGSRTGYVATFALVPFIWLRSGKKLRSLAVILLIGAIGLPLIPPQYVERFQSAFVGEEKEGHSKEERMELTHDAWHLFLEHPQGVGMYGFRYARAGELHKTSMDSHNLYLQILADLGVGGIIVFLLLIFGIVRELYVTDKSLANAERRLTQALPAAPVSYQDSVRAHLADVQFMHATSSAFLAFLFVRLILGAFGHDLYEIYWWLAAGVSIALANMQPTAEARTAEILRAISAGDPKPPVRAPGRRPSLAPSTVTARALWRDRKPIVGEPQPR